jgi:DNA-binding IclR family transcriptional regulator
VGRRVWDLGLLAPVQTGLRQVAEPFLHDIYAATLATVHLAVREGLEVLYLDRLSGRRSVPIVSRVGTRLPAHATAVGKILLAHAPDDVQEATLKSLTRVTRTQSPIRRPSGGSWPGRAVRGTRRRRRR